MLEDSLLPFSFPAIERKKVTAAFDGGRIISDGGVMLLAAVEKELGIADRLASLIADPRNPLLVTHSVADILRARMLAIACGYEDADDLDHLRTEARSDFRPADITVSLSLSFYLSLAMRRVPVSLSTAPSAKARSLVHRTGSRSPPRPD
jgi:hypothetical protein